MTCSLSGISPVPKLSSDQQLRIERSPHMQLVSMYILSSCRLAPLAKGSPPLEDAAALFHGTKNSPREGWRRKDCKKRSSARMSPVCKTAYCEEVTRNLPVS